MPGFVNRRVAGVLFAVIAAGACTTQASEPAVEVNVLNYVRAKSSMHFEQVIMRSGGINKWGHLREPTPLDRQKVRRMNRDTLYSSAVIDISAGATFTLPDAGDRYMSAAVVNQDHYINNIYHGAGTYKLGVEEFDTPYVLLTVRTLVNAADPDDIKKANALQDALRIISLSGKPYTHPDYDQAGVEATTRPLLQLADGLPDATRTYGNKNQVDAVRHLLGTAYGWGGLPETEAYYLNVQPHLPAGAYTLVVKDVPVDGFWSISVYNEDGYFEKNKYAVNSLNSLTATKNQDSSYTLHFGGSPDSTNFLPIGNGWNYVVRMYRPRTEIIDGTWTFPEVTAIPGSLK